MTGFVSIDELQTVLARGAAPLVLDVRRAPAYAAGDRILPGASWRDPAAVESWSAALPRDREIVVYCVRGHEVGQAVAAALRRRGFEARCLAGGIEAWVARGLPTAAKPAGQGAGA